MRKHNYGKWVTTHQFISRLYFSYCAKSSLYLHCQTNTPLVPEFLVIIRSLHTFMKSSLGSEAYSFFNCFFPPFFFFYKSCDVQISSLRLIRSLVWMEDTGWISTISLDAQKKRKKRPASFLFFFSVIVSVLAFVLSTASSDGWELLSDFPILTLSGTKLSRRRSSPFPTVSWWTHSFP